MVTKKTRLMAGFAAVLMLVSLFTAFVLPVSAETTGQAEVISSTGLVDKTALPNIEDGFDANVTSYQVNSRKGMDVLAEVWDYNSPADGYDNKYSFYQTADIDMGWEPYDGIGGSGWKTADKAATQDTSFKNTFDGNGFVIKNLLIYKPDNSQVGLFGRTWTRSKFYNIGIASGLIVGYDNVGSLVGTACAATIVNCWSAATVVGGGTSGAGVGGLIGYAYNRNSNQVKVINSYFVGLVHAYSRYVGGLAGRLSGNSDSKTGVATVTNSYSAAEIVSAFQDTNLFAETPADTYLPGYGALYRATATGAAPSTLANNYYRSDGSGYKSYKDAVAAGVKVDDVAVIDQDAATGMTTEQIKSGALTEALNKGNLSAGNIVSGYTVKYVQTAGGYPAIGYYDSVGQLAVCRTAAEGTSNVMENTFAKNSELYAALSAKREGGLAAGLLENVTIKNENDLFALGVALFQSRQDAIVGTTVTTGEGEDATTKVEYKINPNIVSGTITFENDVDMAKQTMIPGCPYAIPLGMATSFVNDIEGNNKIIYNWKATSIITGVNPTSNLIEQVYNVTIRNLGMVNAESNYDYRYNTFTDGEANNHYIYGGLMIGCTHNYGTATLENCFVTGEINYLSEKSANVNNIAGLVGRNLVGGSMSATVDGVAQTEIIYEYGGPGLTVKNCWSDVTYTDTEASSKVGVVGSTARAAGVDGGVLLDNVFYVSETVDYDNEHRLDGTVPEEGVEYQVNVPTADQPAGYLAAYLNANTDTAWTTTEGLTTFGTAENATRTVTFTATDPANAERTMVMTRYTDSTGKLLQADKALLEAAVWETDVALTERVFTENTAITGTLAAEHDHAEYWIYTPDAETDTHTAVCGFAGCPATLEAEDCVFTATAPDVATVAPADAAHTWTCVCTNTYTEKCAIIANTTDATCVESGSIVSTCDVCGYEHTEILTSLGHDWKWEHVEGTEGDDAEHSRTCTREGCGETETADCSYGEWVTVDATREETGTMTRTCADCGHADVVTLSKVAYLDLVSTPAVAGETIEVQVNLINNPGVAGMNMEIAYDADVLTLTGATAGDIEGIEFIGPVDPDNNVTNKLAFVCNGNITEDGTVVTLTFAVNAAAEASTTKITVSTESSDYNGQMVAIEDGVLDLDVFSVIKGDINGDRYVTIADAVLLLRYVSGQVEELAQIGIVVDEEAANLIDVEGQPAGTIDTADVVRLMQYLNGWFETL